MEIIVSIKSVYGNEQIYPVCAKAESFAAIAGTKTLTQQTLRQVKALGYSIKVSHAKAFVTEMVLN